MSKAIISNRIYMTADAEQQKLLDEELTYTIPSYNPMDPPTVIKNMGRISDKLISIPVGRMDLIPDNYEISEKRTTFPENFPEFRFDLRDSQAQVYNLVEDNAIINAFVSWGKTFTALAIATKLKQKTLVVVHTLALRNQWEEEVEKTLGIKPGIIGSGKFNIEPPIVIANIQTLSKRIKEVSQIFGTLILDECLDYNSKITTKNGQRDIGTIVNNKESHEVLSFNEDTKQFEWKPILRWFKNPQKEDMIKFTFSDKSTLKCTLNHTVYSYNKGKIKAENLLEGDYLIANKSSNILDYTVLEVTDINFEQATGGYRYNIEVADNHNYLAGHKLVSNCHHTPASTFSNIIDKSTARYKIGLSGTLQRKDGKHVILNDYFGFDVHQPKKENYITPRVVVIKSEIRFPDSTKIPWAKRVNTVAYNEEYQHMVSMLASTYAAKGHRVLVVSDRVQFLKRCADLTGNNAVCITGELDHVEREKELSKIKTGSADILYGSQSIFSEGISLNELSVLILGTPLNNEPLLIQLIGRVIRKLEGKQQPVVVDIQLKGNTASKQAKARMGVYIKQGYEMQTITI